MKKTYLVVVSMFFIVFSLCCSLDAYAYQVKVWDNGDADGKWSTPGNWDPDGVPGPGDTVIFDLSQNADCVVDVPDVNVGSLTLAAGYTGMLTLSYDITLSGDLTVHSASILCKGDPSAVNEASGGTVEKPHGKGIVISAANIFVDADGHISADEQGFAAGAGPEPGDSYGEGGGHGGRGGSDGGHTYGSHTAPTALGSGGLINGIGGGAIKLHVSETVTINGTVSATGGDGGRGGGAGGSIWIIADTLAGSGAITADGGYSGSTDYRGGGGGGGRISLQWNSGNMSFDGILRAKGGLKNQGGLANFGSHGTLYVLVPDNPDNAWKELWNANRHVQHDIALAPGEYHFDDLYIDPGVTLECQGDIEAINEASGGEAGNPHGSGVIIHADNITVPQDGTLSTYGMGFYEGQGPASGINFGKGGSHGGEGGCSTGVYGSATAPSALGSGGATEGIGGGAVTLHVSDTLTVNGTVLSDGEDHAYGGGAGGSVWIVTDTLAGSGEITANGGAGTHQSDSRISGGGGGRIATYFNQDISSLGASASGGTGLCEAGQPGTIVWESR